MMRTNDEIAAHPRAFGALVRKYRKAALLTQEQLAERAELSVEAVSVIERGKRDTIRLDTLGRLVTALNLSSEQRTAFIAAAPIESGASSDSTVAASPASAHAPSSLPRPLTSLIGRDAEVADLQTRLREPVTRLLTLVGPGGVGKTRLAIQVASALRDDLAVEGVFVPLAPLAPQSPPDLVLSTIAHSLDVREAGDRSLRDSVYSALRDREAILLLDNFEHVRAATPEVIALLDACPRVKVLVTSRLPLRVRGEQQVPIPPLAVPAPETPMPTQVLAAVPAVALFVQRARMVKPDFALTPANAAAVAEICRRLDGLPLAIELAAARVKLLAPRALLERLGPRLRELGGTLEDLEERQQTLWKTIAWSYELLRPDEQGLFRRLAVFAGGGTLDAVERVCQVGNSEALVNALVDHSLVQVEQSETDTRFVMLETIRAYALEQLDQDGETMVVRQRHAAYYFALAEQAEPELTGVEQAVWLSQLETEHDNIRSALQWLYESGELQIGLRLAGALWRFWWRHGHLSEGRSWLERFLRAAPNGADEMQDAARAKALHGAGVLAYIQDDYAAATIFYEQALQMRRQLGDRQGMAASLHNLALVASTKGELERAESLLVESLSLLRGLGHEFGVATTLYNLGYVVASQDNYQRAQSLLEESLALHRSLGNTHGIADSLNILGMIAGRLGQAASAATLHRESMAWRKTLGDKQGIAAALVGLGYAARFQGAPDLAEAHYRESLLLYRQVGDRLGFAQALEGAAGLATAQGHMERAARLFGAAAHLRAILGAPLERGWRVPYDQDVAVLRASLDRPTFARAWSAGESLTLDQVIDEAVSPVVTSLPEAR